MKTLSDQMLRILERLAEMFPKSHYQSELDRYISNRHPQNAAPKSSNINTHKGELYEIIF
jgi:predicted transcriptional regulator with HTH domain